MRACATRGVKPVTLELGGKSPVIIFEDVGGARLCLHVHDDSFRC